MNEIGKYPTKGTWYDDYYEICQQQHLIPCPFIKIEEINEESSSSPSIICKVINCCLDTGTWRAILVACSCIGTKVIELYLHNVRITSYHLDDLLQLLKINETIQCLKLDYLDIQGDNSLYFLSLKNLLASNTSSNLKYISLIGMGITDQHLLELILPLRNHCTLEGINFNQNLITDQGFISFLNMIPYAIRLNSFSFKSNNLTGQSLHYLINLFEGFHYLPENDQEMKIINKIIQERNKIIKEINKRIKKESKDGIELNELEPITNRIVKSHDHSFIFNNSLRFIDLSWNHAITMSDILSFQSNVSSAINKTNSTTAASPRKEGSHQSTHHEHHTSVLTLCLRGIDHVNHANEHHTHTGASPLVSTEDIYSGRLKIIM